MKIGIYLAYGPHKKSFSLKQEGLGRYLAALLKAFSENGDVVTIACPKWSIDAVYELLEENNINKAKLEFAYAKNIPVILALYFYLEEKKSKSKREKSGKISRAAMKLSGYLLDGVLSIRSICAFVLYMCIAMVLAVIALPFCFIAIMLLLFAFVIIKILSLIKKKTFSLKQIIKQILSSNSLIQELRKQFSLVELLEHIRVNCANDIIHSINAMVKKPDLWYCPTAFWNEFNKIKSVRVLCAPDMVTDEFAGPFSVYFCSKQTSDVRKSIQDGQYYITYCNYLKETLLIQKFGKKSEDIIAIPHAVNDSQHYIDVSECFCRDGFPYDVNMRFARAILKSAMGKVMEVGNYLYSSECAFSMEDVRYLFYASQVRGNKNILNLVKAYEQILKEKNIPIKLFLTANINNSVELNEYVKSHGLQYDVLFFNSVTNQQLAALYKCAELVVNPTFYEGGFPFTFGEGMSVGTPSVMSKIPQVTEVFDNSEYEDFLFDPYDVDDMVEKIVYGLRYREELYVKQEKIFLNMNMRTWEDVGKEYVEAFSYFIKRDKNKNV